MGKKKFFRHTRINVSKNEVSTIDESIYTCTLSLISNKISLLSDIFISVNMHISSFQSFQSCMHDSNTYFDIALNFCTIKH